MTEKSNVGKTISNVLLAVYFFLNGIDFALILPSINFYLQEVGAEPGFIGIVMSAYSIAGLIFAPILGKVTDYVGAAKLTVIFGTLCSIGGSLIYCAVRNKYGIAAARFISGIGMALDGSIIGTLSRTTDPANKSRLVGIMLLCRQVGVMGGPFLVYLVRGFNFTLGPIVIDEFNAAGIFGTFQWSIFLVVFVMLYRDQPVWAVKKDADETDQFVEEKSDDQKYTLKQRTEGGLLQTPIIIALFACFCGFAVQAGLETFVTIYTDWYLGWRQTENSLVFILSGSSATFSYILITALVSRKVLSDRQLLLIGLSMNVLMAHIVVGIIATYSEFRADWLTVTLLVSIVMICIGLPYTVVGSAAMIAKFTPQKDQAFVQSLRTLGERTAMILSQNWYANAIIAVTNYNTGFVLVGATMVPVVVCLAMLFLEWKYLNYETIQPLN